MTRVSLQTLVMTVAVFVLREGISITKVATNRLRHTLHQRTLYFSEHFASQELNTLCSPTHFAKSQFTPQHPLHCYLLLKRTVCFKLACYSLLLNTLYPSAHFAYWNNFLLGTLCFQTLFAS